MFSKQPVEVTTVYDPQIDLALSTSTVVLGDVYCYRFINTVVRMCDSRSLVISTQPKDV